MDTSRVPRRLLAFALLAAGLGISTLSPAVAQDAKTLTIAISGDVETVDPPFSQFQRSNEVNYNIYDQFFRYGWTDTGKGYAQTDIGKIEGSAIESWKWSDDHLALTLVIRKGSTFTKSGRAVTADDFIYWFERAFGSHIMSH